MADKPALHWSQISMFTRCPAQFKERWREGRIVPPGVALLVGSGAHRAIAVDLQTKRDTGSLAAEAVVLAAARDRIVRAFETGDYALDAAERVLGADQVMGDAVDQAVACARVAHTDLVPRVEPVRVEWTWRVEITGYPVALAGTIDADEGNRIDDWKTTAKSPAAGTADKAGQFNMYALAKHVLDQVLPWCRMGFLVKLKRGPKVVWQETPRDLEDVRILLRWVERVVEADRLGIYPYAAAQDPRPWCCSPKFCGYYATCRGVRHPVSVAVGRTPKRSTDYTDCADDGRRTTTANGNS